MTDITFNCPSCQQSLEADAADVGAHIKCPDCNAFIVVPEQIPEKDGDEEHSSRLRFKPLSQGSPSEIKKCPECGTELASGAILCTNCGLNLISGRRMNTVSRKHSSVGMNILFVGLIIAGICGALAWWRMGRHATVVNIEKVTEAVSTPVMLADLHRVVITSDFEFRKANMIDVVAFLNKAFKEECGAEGKATSFLLLSPKGVPVPEITMAGHYMPMDQVLDLIVEAANYSYQFSNNVVVISPAAKIPPQRIHGNEVDLLAMRRLFSSVIVDEVDFRQANIYDIVGFLNFIYKKNGPKGIPANIVLVPQQAGNPGVKPVPEITMSARYIPLTTVLDVITYASGCSWTAVGNVAILRNDACDRPEEDMILEDRNAPFIIGNSWFNGWAGQKDFTKAVRCYRKAADQGHSEAQYILGHCLFTGTGIDKDETAATVWWEKAAQSNLNARTSLGLCYLNGRGVQKNHSKGIEYLRGSADDGDNWAQYYLGSQLFDGGESTNIEAAIYRMDQSAESGNSNAVVALKEMKGKLAKDALTVFRARKDDPSLANNTNLPVVAKAMIRMMDRTSFPTKKECAALLEACGQLLDSDLTNDVRRAVIGSQIRLEYEQEMLEKGLERYAGVFMDKDSIKIARKSAQNRIRELAKWQPKQEQDQKPFRSLKQFGIRKDAEEYVRALSNYRVDPRYFIRQKGGTLWTVCAYNNKETSEDNSPRSQRGGEVVKSSGTSTVTVMPVGSDGYNDYMRSTFGNRIGVTRNAGAFGPIINPGGINW